VTLDSSIICDRDVATDRRASATEIRKADRSRASGPPVPGEGRSPNSPARRRTSAYKRRVSMGRGINGRLIEIRPDRAEDMTLGVNPPGQQQGQLVQRFSTKAAGLITGGLCRRKPLRRRSFLRSACAADHPPNLYSELWKRNRASTLYIRSTTERNRDDSQSRSHRGTPEDGLCAIAPREEAIRGDVVGEA
jgi:hypothetical protein